MYYLEQAVEGRRSKTKRILEVTVLLICYVLLVTQYKTEEDSKIVILVQIVSILLPSLLLLILDRGRAIRKVELSNLILFTSISLIFFINALVTSGSLQQTILANFFSFLGLILILSIRWDSLLLVLKIYIVTNACLILIQVIVYSLFGYYIEMHSVIFPFSIEAEYTYWYGGARFSGIHAEPGSYSNAIGISTIIYMLIREKGKLDIIVALSIISILITRSLSGIFYISLILMLLLNRKNILKLAIISLPLCFIILAFAGSMIAQSDAYQYYYERLTGSQNYTDNSMSAKAVNFNDVYLRDTVTLFTGYGLGNNECQYCESIRGNGSLFYSMFFMGLFGVVIFIPLLKKLRSRYTAILILCLISTRFTFLNPFFWIVYFLIINSNRFIQNANNSNK